MSMQSDRIDRAVELLDERAEGWSAPEPLPLPDELPEVPAFPIDALPDSLRPWVEDVSDRMQCPADFVAVPLLVAAASLVARHVAIRPQARTDWTERANLWALIVGRPGAMKSPALAQALAPIERLERAARADHAEQMTAFELDALEAKLRKEAAEGAAKAALKRDPGADVAHLLRGAQEPGPPPRVRYIVHDTTYEALGVILAQNPGGTLSVRDEMKSLLADLSKEERAAQRGFFVQAWSGGSYTFDRIGRGHIHIEDARLSMLGGIQPGPLAELIAASRSVSSAADGLLERFLVSWPDDPRDWREVDRWPDSEARRLAYDAFDYLHALTPEAVGAEQDTTRQGEAYGPLYLRFAGGAMEAFADWRAELEHKLRDSDSSDGMESALSKFRHHVPALALTLHLLDGNHGPVCQIATLRALALAEYFEAHTKRCYSSSRRATVRSAKAILRKLETGALAEPFSARDVHRKCWSGLSDARTVADALDMLAAHGRLIEDAIETGGRPKTIYCRPEGGAS